MGIEIERKFLVIDDSFILTSKNKTDIVQGYLSADPGRTVRVRLENQTAFITIKGIGVGLKTPEFEYEIPYLDGIELIQMCNHKLWKTRYKIPFEGNLWEVDVFGDKLKGLIIAEIELFDENQNFSKPKWIGEEVTGDRKYYNSYLAQN